VVLRRGRPADAEAIARAVGENLDHLRPWLVWATPVAATTKAQRERMVVAAREWDTGTSYEYVILGPDEDAVVGSCGLHRRGEAGSVEIGYWVHADCTRRGYATAAARALTHAAWSLPDVNQVEIHCDEDNAPSRAIPARLGYRLDRVEDDRVKAPQSGKSMIWVLERDAGGPVADPHLARTGDG